MKNFFRFLVIALLSSAVFAGCNTGELVNPVLLELDRSNMKMTVGQSQQLNAVLKGSDEDCLWKTADASVATVDQNGLVTAVAAGKTVITVQAGEVSTDCNVEVVDFKADALELNEDIQNNLLVVNAGQEYQLVPKFYKGGEKVNDMAFPVFKAENAVPSRNGEEVATIDQNGLIKALAPGKVTMSVSGAGVSKSFTLMVKEVTLDKTSLQLFVEESADLSVAVLPTELPESERLVEWYSSDKESVSVDASGHVRGLKVTSEPVEISAVSRNVTAICLVTVVEFTAHSVEITNLDEVVRKHDNKYEMYVGDIPVTLVAQFKDAAGNDVSNKVTNRTFISSDNSVASISQTGELKALASGKTTITVSGAGVEKSFELNVIQGVESLQIDPSGTKTVFKGDEPFKLNAVVYPENATVKTVSYTSDKPEVASVDAQTGLVTILKDGVARITVTTDGFKRPIKGDDGNYVHEKLSSVLLLTVVDKSSANSKVTISAENIVDGTLVIQKGSTVQLTATTDPAGYDGTYSWMVTNDVISVDDNGKLTAVAVGSSVVAVLAASEAWGTAMGELPVNVTGVNPTSIEITNGESIKTSVADPPIVLVAKATAPSNADFAGVNWYSSNEKVVKVSQDGKLSYTGVGKAVITAKAKTWDGKDELSGVSDTFEIETLNAAITDFDIVWKEGGIFISDRYYVEEGETITLGYETIPMGAVPNTVSWTSSSDTNATVSAKGVVTGRECSVPKGSEVIITCIIDGSIEREFKLMVVEKQPEDITATLPGRALKVDEEWNLNPKVIPESLGLYANPSFGVPVQNGIFKTSVPGTYYVGFYVSASQSESVIMTLQRTFTVNVEPYWVESVSIPATADMEVGTTMVFAPDFKSDVDGVEPTYKDVKWESLNPAIASVDESTGEITAHKAGTVQIKVTTNNDWSVPGGTAHKSAVCTLTVKNSGVALNVGDYYYSDGTWSSQLDPAKTVIGVVFAKVNAASSDLKMAADKPECTHGLVVSTVEYTSAYTKDRSWSLRDAESWMYKNGYTQYNDTNKPVGYSNTKGFIELHDAKVESYGHTIDFALYGSDSPVRIHRNAVAAPNAATDWYIPSFKEMQLLSAAMSIINPVIESLSGTKVGTEYPYQYWCSTSDYDGIGVRAVTMDNGQWMATGKTESSALPVRVILAF